MKQSIVYSPTLREVPSDADIKSHQLLLRAGFIRQNASGIYSFLPLGNKVLQKVANIVREEMNNAGAMEMLMPSMQAQELWEESGRWDNFGPELMRLRDRHGRGFALGATHEEVVTSIIRDELKSYKKLPITLYQVQSKFRDEKRPRFGLLRGREFLMKDAYSFHASQESLDEVYDRLFTAYSNVFTRCGLNFRAVVADSGAMGGKDTHEFMVLSDIGEDTIAFSNESSYAANIEMAPVVANYEPSDEKLEEVQKVETPNQKTIDEVIEFLNLPIEKSIKSIIFKADESFVLVLARGDHEINDIKLKNYLGAHSVELASKEEVKELMNCEIGSLGPIGVKSDLLVLADNAIKGIVNGCCGANEEGYHYINVTVNRDYDVKDFVDLRFIQEGDLSPDGKGTISFAKGIEVGHVFKLGTKYSESMNATFLDENGKSNPIIMGCYGIGVSRTLAAIVEQYNDEKGIVWPKNLAPFDVHVITVNTKNEEQVNLADDIYKTLKEIGQDVLLDDRNERVGVKFADADLFGIPVRVVVGKKAAEGIVELKTRDGQVSKEVEISNLVNEINMLK
ncbi:MULTISPECIES: proline--tRNA ligase [Bacillaceae]|uniref:Proline--tRNA ligase n=1 Tax=Gottfriedia luciferensis TaxID=178774 RepID=A0ABX2ZN49_9BACI|nr:MULTISPECIES: proline--tRNA ligase [Bacillaceae]ODG91161.1 proline--tRNA ligase [Gottfriedia luciferensis]PGZ94879.1 proline--tRNA ligase [Bacillus sp. AFS029533]SFC78324.1 prolyl-tRNA synthetase [Bacillus sp. UNCCL81]